jgi:hypothetical protein
MKPHNGVTADAVQATALVVDTAQPVWMTLNQARERAFTGEIVFETQPEVLAYLDHGSVYYAERATDVSLGRRLLDAGVLDIGQLGRLFDRDPSVDRDAVVVIAETATETLIAELANTEVATARVTAYRHHPSGVHRWFVAPLDPATVQRPVGAVAQLDSTVVDQLPGLPFTDAEELTIEWDDPIDDELTIDDGGLDNGGFDISLLEPPMSELAESGNGVDVPGADLPAEDDEFSLALDLDPVEAPSFETEAPADELLDADAFAMSLDLAEFTDDTTELDGSDESDGWSLDQRREPTLDQLVDVVTVDEADHIASSDEGPLGASQGTVDGLGDDETDDFEFAVVWPDGTEHPATPAEPPVDTPHAADDAAATLTEPPSFDAPSATTLDTPSVPTVDAPSVPTLDAPSVPTLDGSPDDVAVATSGDTTADWSVVETESGDLEFTMPPLELSDEPELADEAVPDDVADAVRRAIAAIESAGIVPTPAGEVTTQLPAVASDDVGATAASAPSPGFAPPTMATRAEVLYGQMTADGAPVDDGRPRLPAVEPKQGVASVVFVDEPAAAEEHGSGGDNERSSALRRLIGSLRRKDH